MLEDDEKYFEGKRFKRLLERYETAMEQTGTIYMEPDELTDIAEYYAMNGRMDDANRAVDLALALHPGSVDPQVFLSRQQMFLGNMQRAYELCDVIADQEDREVLFLRAELMLNEEKNAEALDFMQNIYKRLDAEDEPDFFLYDCAALLYDYSAWSEACILLEELRNKYPDCSEINRANRLYISSLLEQGECERLLPIADKHLDTNPYDTDVWTAKGEAHAALNNLEAGLEAAEFALAIDPIEPRAQVLAGNCNFHLGHYAEAQHIFEDYLTRYPDESSARYLNALCLSALDRHAEALEQIEQVDMSSPSVETMRDGILLHRAMSEARMGHLDRALMFEAMFEQEKQHTAASFDLQKGFIYLYCEHIDEAMKHLRRGLTAAPPMSIAFEAPILCIEQGYVEQAIELLKLMDEVYARDAERERIAPMLAHCYYQTRNKHAFLRTFQRAIMHEPKLTADVFRGEFPNVSNPHDLYLYIYKQLYGHYPTEEDDEIKLND